MFSWSKVLVLLAVFGMIGLTTPQARAAAPGCGQGQVEALLGAPPPPGASRFYIAPAVAVTPFYQWENNNGYCGEVSLMTGGLSNGQWLSQYNTRAVCGGFFGPEANGSGPSLRQAGNIVGKKSNYNAQLLLESPAQGLAGPYDYDWVGRCAANAGLASTQYPFETGYQTRDTGLAGYKDFMSWIKAQVIAGHEVAFGVILTGGTDPQYDHIVTVIKIGTNHSPTDPAYYPDDVIYFDDHGAYTLRHGGGGGWAFRGNPSVPPGAGNDKVGCTPYVYAYSFASLVKTRARENVAGAGAYAVVMPDADTIVRTGAGNMSANGRGTAAVEGPRNVAFAILGPVDTQNVTNPVTLAIVKTSTSVNGKWVGNAADVNSTPAAGYNYETPYIGGPDGACNEGDCVSNTQPAAMKMVFRVTVNKLVSGVSYNLYEYDFPTQTGAMTGTAAALAIPTEDFNTQSGKASFATPFVARGDSYTISDLVRFSNQIVVFRAVPASGP